MNFVADESVDIQIVERLRDDGYFDPFIWLEHKRLGTPIGLLVCKQFHV